MAVLKFHSHELFHVDCIAVIVRVFKRAIISLFSGLKQLLCVVVLCTWRTNMVIMRVAQTARQDPIRSKSVAAQSAGFGLIVISTIRMACAVTIMTNVMIIFILD